MEQDLDFRRQVERAFDYLVADMGFCVVYQEYHPEHYRNSLVVLASKTCQVRIILEQEQVFVDMGTTHAPRDWHEADQSLWFPATTIASFLTNGADRWAFQQPDESLGLVERIDKQLVWLAGKLRAYWPQACRLFDETAFAAIQPELDACQARLTQEIFGH